MRAATHPTHSSRQQLTAGVSGSQGMLPGLQRALAALPSSIFAAAQPGQSFTVAQRVASYAVKVVEYGVVGALPSRIQYQPSAHKPSIAQGCPCCSCC